MCGSCVMLAWPMVPIKLFWYAQDMQVLQYARLRCNRQGLDEIGTA